MSNGVAMALFALIALISAILPQPIRRGVPAFAVLAFAYILLANSVWGGWALMHGAPDGGTAIILFMIGVPIAFGWLVRTAIDLVRLMVRRWKTSHV